MHAPVHSNRAAQASIETLLAFVIFLSAFAIVYASGSRLASAGQSRLAESLAQSSFDEFSGKLQSACALGSGNVRMVEVKGAPASLLQDGNSVVFTAGSFSSRANSSCPASIADESPSRTFRMENKEGTVEISPWENQ
jgi:hypothetical protein